jgi:hypothetical protein
LPKQFAMTERLTAGRKFHFAWRRLIQRFASVDEIANMVVYVASREASVTDGAAAAGRRWTGADHRIILVMQTR